MKNRRHILLVLMISGVAGLLYFALQPRLPTYEGQSLAVWFKKLPPQENLGGFIFGPYVRHGDLITSADIDIKEWHRTLQAIQTIGTNGLPYIMMKFTREDNRIEKWLEKAATTIGIRLSFGDPKLDRKQSVTALLANIPLPPDVVLRLKDLSASTNRDISTRAKYVLSMNSGGHKLNLEGPKADLNF